MKTSEVLRSIDWILMGASILLGLIGLAMLFSSTHSHSLFSSRFVKQAIILVVSIIISLLVARIPYHSLKKYALILYSLAIIGLSAIFFFAQVIRGAASRVGVFGIQIQPSEFAKIALIIMFSLILSQSGRVAWRTLLKMTIIAGVPVSLIIIEPDLGVAALIFGVWVGMLIFKGMPWRIIFILGLLGLVLMLASWQWLLVDYQKNRLMTFVDPSRDPLGSGYNVTQSIVALGSGGLFGRGLGHGPQSQLEFLPERHTDFVLASTGEELGFIGLSVVMALYVIVLWRILLISRITRDPFGQTVTVGIFLLLLISFVVSAGMNMGILPVTGIPLPMLSYGGSNLLSTFILLGIVQSIHIYSKWVQAPPTEISHFI